MQELEKTMEEIQGLHGEVGSECTPEDHYLKRAWEHCLYRVTEIIRKHMNDGWIPVEEQLPEDEEMVLVTCQAKSGRRSINRAWYGDGFWHGTGSMSGVIAWRALPEPYQPEAGHD